jgi:hypothetical protein
VLFLDLDVRTEDELGGTAILLDADRKDFPQFCDSKMLFQPGGRGLLNEHRWREVLVP